MKFRKFEDYFLKSEIHNMPYTIHNTQYIVFYTCVKWLLKPLSIWIRRIQMTSLLYKWVVGSKTIHVGFVRCSCNSREVTWKSLCSRFRVNHSQIEVACQWHPITNYYLCWLLYNSPLNPCHVIAKQSTSPTWKFLVSVC